MGCHDCDDNCGYTCKDGADGLNDKTGNAKTTYRIHGVFYDEMRRANADVEAQARGAWICHRFGGFTVMDIAVDCPSA